MSDGNAALRFLDTITHELDTSYRLNDQHRSGLSVYYLDLSPLRVRLSTHVPCIHVTGGDFQDKGASTVFEMVQQEILFRQERPGSSFVLVDGDASFLARLAKDPYWSLVLGGSELTEISNHENPKVALLNLIRTRTPLRFLSPYEPNEPVTGSQFHGRTYEVNLIMTHADRSYSIEGGRRIGKTSLLKEVRLRLGQRMPESHMRLVWYDCWGYAGTEAFVNDVIRHFGESLRPARGGLIEYFPRFIKAMRKKHKGRIVFFLDEVDDLIDYERQHGYELLGMLKRIAGAEDCRCLLAGFRVLSEESYYHGTPLSFCQRLPLSNLNLTQAKSMLITPMNQLGIDLENEPMAKILR